jgi:hypothetical protein
MSETFYPRRTVRRRGAPLHDTSLYKFGRVSERINGRLKRISFLGSDITRLESLEYDDRRASLRV